MTDRQALQASLYVNCHCMSWAQLVRRLKGPNDMDKLIDFDTFSGLFYPQLFEHVAQPPPALLVWAEYFNRIQSFQRLITHQFKPRSSFTTATMLGRGEGWPEYEATEVSSLGVALSTADKELIFESYIEYCELKHSRGSYDSVDLAMSMIKSAQRHAGYDEIYIDEAQVTRTA